VYTATIFKKSIKLFNQSSLVIDVEHVDRIHQLVFEEYLPEYDMIYRQRDESLSTNKFKRSYKKINRLFKDDVDKGALLEKLEQ
jgi:deoxycytidine triphosphate deaminase